MINRPLIAVVTYVVAGFFALHLAGAAIAKENSRNLIKELSKTEATEATYTNAQVLQKSVAVAGNLVGTPQVALEFLTLDTIEIRCPRRNCRIEAVMYAQASTSVANNPFAICFRVDGQFGDLGCPTVGELQQGESTFLFGHNTLNLKTGLSKGIHTVSIQYWSKFGTSVHSYAGFFKSYTKRLR